jgi:hypothetical protein
VPVTEVAAALIPSWSAFRELGNKKVGRLALTSTTADRSLTRFLGSTPLMGIDRGAEHLDSGDESCV